MLNSWGYHGVSIIIDILQGTKMTGICLGRYLNESWITTALHLLLTLVDISGMTSSMRWADQIAAAQVKQSNHPKNLSIHWQVKSSLKSRVHLQMGVTIFYKQSNQPPSTNNLLSSDTTSKSGLSSKGSTSRLHGGPTNRNALVDINLRGWHPVALDSGWISIIYPPGNESTSPPKGTSNKSMIFLVRWWDMWSFSRSGFFIFHLPLKFWICHFFSENFPLP